MKEQLEHLIRLQEIDSRIAECQKRSAAIPLLIEERENLVQESENRLSEIRTGLDQAAAERRDKERELADRESRLSKLKDKQSEIKTNREYQAFLGELEAGKQDVGQIEEELLLIMERSEDGRKELSRAELAHQDVVKTFNAAKAALESESAVLDADLARMDGERTGLQKKVRPDLLKMYREILAVLKDAAVVAVRNGICSGCHMNVPPQLIANVRKHESVIACHNCRRILYDESLCVKAG